MKLPEKYIQQMQVLLQNDFEDYLSSFKGKPFLGIRVNTQKIHPDFLKNIFGDVLSSIQWCPEGFYYNGIERPAKHPLYSAGLYYIQEPSAMSSASLLDIQPGHKVLDLCAAPGGKSTQVGAKLLGQGVLVANDISASRCKALLKNLELWGITNSVITNERPERLSGRFTEYFDRILVDVPCSGEGMFRKDPDVIKSWSINKSTECCILQRNILFHAAKMLAPDGQIMYSTCTFSPDENENMIEDFLAINPDFELLPIDHQKYGFDMGLVSKQTEISRCARLWPHKLKGEGHFLACLHKKSNTENNHQINIQHPKPIKGIEYFYDFCAQYLNICPQGLFELHGESLFLIPQELPSLNGIRLARSGFYLGDLKTKRFEPSQAFAMSLKMQDAKYVINFSIDGEYILRYLKGESFEFEGKNGWNLICCAGFPVGWGKVQNGRIKNKYFKGWVMN